MLKGVFKHGKFHRDFHVEKFAVDQRYNRWLSQLYKENIVWGLICDGHLAGFAAIKDNGILLNAMDEEYRGQNLRKSVHDCCLFDAGWEEVFTSLSASNLAMLNLVAWTGFEPFS